MSRIQSIREQTEKAMYRNASGNMYTKTLKEIIEYSKRLFGIVYPSYNKLLHAKRVAINEEEVNKRLYNDTNKRRTSRKKI